VVGATQGVDRRGEDWVETVLELTDERGADHVLEIVGGPHLGRAAAVGGRVSQIGALEGFEITTPVMPLMLKDISIQGIGSGHRRALEDLVRAVDGTGLTPVIDSWHPFSELPAALDRLDSGPFGKVVVEL
jgi:NADPH:quinone reductase-like Zn-dependent oxidoreductase